MANTPFLKSFNDLLEAALTDTQNQFENADISLGSVHHLLAAVRSSAAWGYYKYLDWIARQLLPTTCDSDVLDHHASIRNITRGNSETDAELLQRLLTRLRYPSSGASALDWSNWAEETFCIHTTYTERIKDTFIYENVRGGGTINVVVTSDRSAGNGGEEEPTSELLAATDIKLDAMRPVGIWDFQVIAATKKTQAVTISAETSCNKTQAKADITALMKGLNVGKYLSKAQLISVCVQNGAVNPTVSAPSSDIVTVTTGPTVYERIWPGTITIN